MLQQGPITKTVSLAALFKNVTTRYGKFLPTGKTSETFTVNALIENILPRRKWPRQPSQIANGYVGVTFKT